MSTGPFPYDFEPTFTEEELRDRSNIRNNIVETDSDSDLPARSSTHTSGQESRRENTDWCSCGETEQLCPSRRNAYVAVKLGS